MTFTQAKLCTLSASASYTYILLY